MVNQNITFQYAWWNTLHNCTLIAFVEWLTYWILITDVFCQKWSVEDLNMTSREYVAMEL